MPAGFIAWLSHIPLATLYLLMALFAAIENVFPPVPADTVVALGSWLAARGEGSAFWAILATWVGNVVGAGAMYAVGRRHGAAWMHRKFPSLGDARGEQRLRELHGRYGAVALVLSRFIPGIRAIVPPFAGALRLSPVSTMLSIGIASAIWYGLISWLAFRAGADWSSLMQTVTRSGRIVAIVSVALVAVALLGWWIYRRTRARR